MPTSASDPSDHEYDPANVHVEPMPTSFYGLLNAIRNRPSLYLGRKSLKDLHSWLGGYGYARFQSGRECTADEQEFADFDEFVCRKYDWFDVGGWSAKIAYYNRDDAMAFDEFFKLLDQFRESKKARST
jgi:hypothetical protein